MFELIDSKIAWHWRPRNKIWGWRRLYDRFLYSERQKRRRQQIYNNINNNNRNHVRYLNNFNNHHNYYYNYYDYEDPKYSTTQEQQFLGGSWRSSSSKREHQLRQLRTRAWGTIECENHTSCTSHNSLPPLRQKINEEFNRYYS